MTREKLVVQLEAIGFKRTGPTTYTLPDHPSTFTVEIGSDDGRVKIESEHRTKGSRQQKILSYAEADAWARDVVS